MGANGCLGAQRGLASEYINSTHRLAKNLFFGYFQALISFYFRRISKLICLRMMNPLVATDFVYNMTKNGQEYNHHLNKLHSFTFQV